MTVTAMSDRDLKIWLCARPYLDVRNNDEHTAHAYWLARTLLDLHPAADPDIVLPAILMHDVGWKSVPDDERMLAITPGVKRPDIIRKHEIEGAAIARRELAGSGLPIEAIAAIIDGHDSRPEAISLEDSLVKDADKLWRFTPHGLQTINGWFGFSPAFIIEKMWLGAHGGRLLTEAAQTMAKGFIAASEARDAVPGLMQKDH